MPRWCNGNTRASKSLDGSSILSRGANNDDKSMKLTEIQQRTRELFENAIRLEEVFDTKIPINNWHTNGVDRIGSLTINDHVFRIKLQPRVFQDITFVNVAFEVYDKQHDVWHTNATVDNRAASKVLGAIVNGITEELNNFEIDAIVFFANDLTDKRMRIYNSLASLKMKDFGHRKENITTKTGKLCTIIFNKKLSVEHIDYILDSEK